MKEMNKKVNPIVVEIIKNKLISIVGEITKCFN